MTAETIEVVRQGRILLKSGAGYWVDYLLLAYSDGSFAYYHPDYGREVAAPPEGPMARYKW